MLSSFPPMYRLTARGGVGLARDERGIALGPVPLVEALSAGSRRVFRPRPAEEEHDGLARRCSGDRRTCMLHSSIAAVAVEAGMGAHCAAILGFLAFALAAPVAAQNEERVVKMATPLAPELRAIARTHYSQRSQYDRQIPR